MESGFARCVFRFPLYHQHINVLALASPLASVASLPASSAPSGLQGLPAAARVDLPKAGRDERMVQFVLIEQKNETLSEQTTLDNRVDLSTIWRMSIQNPAPEKVRNRQIVGISISPEMATSVKTEAAKRGISLRKLFEEMWATYEKARAKAES